MELRGLLLNTTEHKNIYKKKLNFLNNSLFFPKGKKKYVPKPSAGARSWPT